jgi:hypothetical protein
VVVAAGDLSSDLNARRIHDDLYLHCSVQNTACRNSRDEEYETWSDLSCSYITYLILAGETAILILVTQKIRLK